MKDPMPMPACALVEKQQVAGACLASIFSIATLAAMGAEVAVHGEQFSARRAGVSL